MEAVAVAEGRHAQEVATEEGVTIEGDMGPLEAAIVEGIAVDQEDTHHIEMSKPFRTSSTVIMSKLLGEVNGINERSSA